jgi:hypothetical protein
MAAPPDPVPPAPRVRVVGSGVIDDGDCAFPQVAVAAGGVLVCVYCRGGGQFATGVSVAARSEDRGATWTPAGAVVPATDDRTSTMLRASSLPGSDEVYAYGALSTTGTEDRFGERPVHPILCTSSDGGRTWSTPQRLPAPTSMLEISHGVLPLSNGRLLAPAATIHPGRLGAEVLLAESPDRGRTWGSFVPVMQDPAGRLGYLEHKLTDLGDGRILLTCWTIDMAGVTDLPNSCTVSEDFGRTWTPPRGIGIRGQTLSTIALGGDRLLVLYNRRYGRQGVVAALATLADGDWPIHDEVLVHDAGVRHQRPPDADGIEEMAEFTFGFPTAVLTGPGEALVTFWAGPYGHVAVRWARLAIDWP